MFGARHPLGTHAVRSAAVEMQPGGGFRFRLCWVKSRYALLACVASSSQQQLSRNGTDPHRGKLQGTHRQGIEQAESKKWPIATLKPISPQQWLL
jgi:hypothetical protein